MAGEESQSTPALIHIPESSSSVTLVGGETDEMGAVGGGGGPTAGVPENNLRESCTRLSISLEENGLYKVCALKFWSIFSRLLFEMLQFILLNISEYYCTSPWDKFRIKEYIIPLK